MQDANAKLAANHWHKPAKQQVSPAKTHITIFTHARNRVDDAHLSLQTNQQDAKNQRRQHNQYQNPNPKGFHECFLWASQLILKKVSKTLNMTLPCLLT